MASHQQTDRLTRLAVRMKRGDRKAAAALYDEFLPKVYGFLYTRTGKREVAEDLAHDVFIKLIERVDGFDEARGGFVVWFWRMVRNMLVDFYRKKKEVPFSSFEEGAVEAMAVDGRGPDLDDKLRHEKLIAFLGTLNDGDRELFEYRYVAELSYAEIAALTGKTEGSLRVAALRIKGKIKQGLKDV
ncbi:MAG TPA: sigma-70 family RNA polymerase sigma factor [Candidatus Paceibacterota bacterium]|nr:sigma-70 family RNA polymerase sigma factor [Candidatus Paceibacterota bacterium]